jgi:signal transduction histidine kinase
LIGSFSSGTDLTAVVNILIATACADFLLALYSLRYRKSPGTIYYFLLLLAVSLYSLGYAMELRAVTIGEILKWIRVEYIGISFIPSLLLMLSLHYTGRKRLLTPALILALVLYGTLTFLVETINFRGLFFTSFRLAHSPHYVFADFSHGPWYWFHQAMMNLALLTCIILYAVHVAKTTGRNRVRASVMLVSCLIPYLIYLFYISGLTPYHFDVNPFSFTLVGFLFAVGVLRFQLLEYLPLTMEHIFNSMADAVITIDRQGHLVEFNQAAGRLYPELLQKSRGEPLQFPMKGLPASDELQDGFETDMEMKQGNDRVIYHIRVVAVKNDRNRHKGWTIIFTDVTERHLKESRLMHKEKMLKAMNSDKDKFLAIIGHDLRNSFHLIINLSEILITNLQQNKVKDAETKGKIIYDTAVDTYHLLQNLLEWALYQQKGMHAKKTDHNITRLIQEEIQGLRTLYEQKELTVLFDDSRQTVIQVDREMLRTIVRNLLSNAIKYSYPEGKIEISLKEEPDFVTISIADEGIGMSPEEQEKLFATDGIPSKKGTASETGTGLGLRLCREFVQLHGGTISVTSEPEVGSTFSFTLHLTPGPSPAGEGR